MNLKEAEAPGPWRKAKAQIGLQDLGIKGRMNLRHSGVNTVSIRCCVSSITTENCGRL